MEQLKWYSMHQNNSGAHLIIDDDVAPVVLIQATSADHVNEMVEAGKFKNLYFGWSLEQECKHDCGCCGDRWTPVDSDSYNVHADGVETEVRIHRDDQLKLFLELIEKYPDLHDTPVIHLGSGVWSITTSDIRLIAMVIATWAATSSVFFKHPASAIIYYLDGTKNIIR